MRDQRAIEREVIMRVDAVNLNGLLTVPAGADGLVLFAHGSGSSRFSPRNRFVAEMLNKAGTGTLLFDLLTTDEEAADAYNRHLRFDIGLLARRLAGAAVLVSEWGDTAGLRIGFFGSSTGGAAALVAAAELGDRVGAVVSRGGRPDLAGPALADAKSPTLLIVGERDETVIELNRQALEQMSCVVDLQIIPNATHLFEEPGTLEQVAGLASEWFLRFLTPRSESKSA